MASQNPAQRERWIRDIYFQEFGTAPDAAGLRYWMGRTDLPGGNDLRAGIQQTAAQQQQAGPSDGGPVAAAPGGGHDAGSIAEIYYQELGRVGKDVDQAGLDYWATRTDLTPEELRRAIRGAAGHDTQSVVAPLLQDQTYMEFMNQAQFDESQIQSNLQAAREAADRRIKGQAGTFKLQKENALRGVNQDFEARGMGAASARQSYLMREGAARDQSENQFNTSISEGLTVSESRAAEDVARIRNRGMTEAAHAAQRLTEESGIG